MNFKQLLSRADDVVLQELVGAPVVRILRYIDPNLARPGKLRELLLDLHPPDELLRDKGSRQLLLEGLHEDSARALLLDLDLDPGHNPFDKLAGLRIRKDSAKESQLFSFFGEVPRADPPRETKLDRVVVDGNYQLFTHQ